LNMLDAMFISRIHNMQYLSDILAIGNCFFFKREISIVLF
jgi:hypothetical protein